MGTFYYYFTMFLTPFIWMHWFCFSKLNHVYFCSVTFSIFQDLGLILGCCSFFSTLKNGIKCRPGVRSIQFLGSHFASCTENIKCPGLCKKAHLQGFFPFPLMHTSKHTVVSIDSIVKKRCMFSTATIFWHIKHIVCQQVLVRSHLDVSY